MIIAASAAFTLASSGLAYYLMRRHKRNNQGLDPKLPIKEEKWIILNQNQGEKTTLHVMTYNILAECYIGSKQMASSNRRDPLHHKLALTDFEYRANRIVRQIGERALYGKPMPDIIGF